MLPPIIRITLVKLLVKILFPHKKFDVMKEEAFKLAAEAINDGKDFYTSPKGYINTGTVLYDSNSKFLAENWKLPLKEEFK